MPVSGQVLIDGQPLIHGAIRFIPEGARASAGVLDQNGHFTLTCFDGGDGAVPGTHRIEVAAGEIISETATRWHAPKKYADFQTSGLTAEIDEPTADLVLELTWNGAAPFVEQD